MLEFFCLWIASVSPHHSTCDMGLGARMLVKFCFENCASVWNRIWSVTSNCAFCLKLSYFHIVDEKSVLTKMKGPKRESSLRLYPLLFLVSCYESGIMKRRPECPPTSCKATLASVSFHKTQGIIDLSTSFTDHWDLGHCLVILNHSESKYGLYSNWERLQSTSKNSGAIQVWCLRIFHGMEWAPVYADAECLFCLGHLQTLASSFTGFAFIKIHFKKTFDVESIFRTKITIAPKVL